MKPISQIIRKSISASLLAIFFLGGNVIAADAAPAQSPTQAPPPQHGEETPYATVNGQVITISEYANFFNAALRQKFYHGQVPEGQMAEVREQVTDKMVLRILLTEEAKRRKLVPDEKKIAETIAGYEAQYAASPFWKENRERLLPGLRAQITGQNLVEQLEKSVRAVPDPTDAEVKQFYAAHPELFTEPEKLRLSVILLAVDPSSPKEVWDKARAEAQALYERLRGGADFAEAARIHSSGKEAGEGGDLGYVHRGMLPDTLQEKIDELKVGVVAEPITILEGVAIFYLKDRRVAQLRAFADVTERARGLARREREDAAWSALHASLKAGADIKIHDKMKPAGGEERR